MCQSTHILHQAGGFIRFLWKIKRDLYSVINAREKHSNNAQKRVFCFPFYRLSHTHLYINIANPFWKFTWLHIMKQGIKLALSQGSWKMMI